MTPRERKYHSRIKFNRFYKGLFGSSDKMVTTERHFNFYNSATREIEQSNKPGDPVTITLTKYNLPQNSGLQKGQLN